MSWDGSGGASAFALFVPGLGPRRPRVVIVGRLAFIESVMVSPLLSGCVYAPKFVVIRNGWGRPLYHDDDISTRCRSFDITAPK